MAPLYANKIQNVSVELFPEQETVRKSKRPPNSNNYNLSAIEKHKLLEITETKLILFRINSYTSAIS